MGIEFKQLSFAYGGQQVLDKISCRLRPGCVHVVLGINGAGKSTLIKLLAGFLKPGEGSVLLGNKPLKDLTLHQRAQRIAYVPQQQQTSYLLVFDYLLLGRKPHRYWQSGRADDALVCAMLERLDLSHLAQRALSQLSGGELQKIALARAFVQEPKVLLLDEPTSSLDLKNQLEVMEMIALETSAKNLTTIITVHDVNLALRFAESFVLMKDRKILAFGDLEVMSPEHLSQLYGLPLRMYRQGNCLQVVPENNL
ncbi:MAG: ABC transporter ATP-binding protein [Desulfuromonadales bacterium]|nr:ABC transporter ATP-binding protein [Desulfuromonadales bacterium]